jgi:hypothetical protein
MPHPEEQARVGKLMFGKFPEIKEYIDFGETMGELALFRIDAEVISLLDYAKGFLILRESPPALC